MHVRLTLVDFANRVVVVILSALSANESEQIKVGSLRSDILQHMVSPRAQWVVASGAQLQHIRQYQAAESDRIGESRPA